MKPNDYTASNLKTMGKLAAPKGKAKTSIDGIKSKLTPMAAQRIRVKAKAILGA